MDCDVTIEPGAYIIAVSGGIDSVVLLDMLNRRPGLRLTIAHFDHGIRPDSAADRQFVAGLAREHGLPFVYAEGRLGADASEATARQARYDFLRRTQEAAAARAIVTAHHQDDVMETAIFNIIRGSGRRGLASLQSTDDIMRPLLHVSKARIVAYARDNRLAWREDSTNADYTYSRNYIRHNLLSRFSPAYRHELHEIVVGARQTNRAIDEALDELMPTLTEADGRLRRQQFIMLPHVVAGEVMAAWLRANGITEIDAALIERLVCAAKTYRAGRAAPAKHGWHLVVSENYLALEHIER